jgi:hypothetical protein
LPLPRRCPARDNYLHRKRTCRQGGFVSSVLG